MKFIPTGALALVLSVVVAGCKGESPSPITPPVVTTGAPTASFTAQASASANAPVTFDASASTSRDGSALQ